MEDNTKESAQLITVIPRTVDTLVYQINSGGKHLIRKRNAMDFFTTYVEHSNYRELRRLLDWNLPFVILPERNELIELTKQEVDPSYYRSKIEAELDGVTKYGDQREQKKTDMKSVFSGYDAEVERISKKTFLKK